MASDHDTGRKDGTLRLPDGRRLGYAEYGDPNGAPVLLFHGVPGSRLTAIAEAAGTEGTGMRFIGIDRPGMGLSDFQRGRRILDWPRDVSAFADIMGFARFAVLGGSGGGPYALACARVIPDRLSRVVVVNGMAPLDRDGALAGYRPLSRFAWWSLANVPFETAAVAWLQMRTVRGDPEQMVRRMAARMAPDDRAALQDPTVRRTVARQISEAFRQGWRGVAHDVRLLTRPWGFRLRDVRTRVDLWQGTGDRNVPAEMGRFLAAGLPNCQARFVDGTGHLMHERRDEILSVLADRAPAAGAEAGAAPGSTHPLERSAS